MDQRFFIETKDGKIMRVRVIPNSSKNEMSELEEGIAKIKLTAPPVDGKANKCLIEFLSKTFDLLKSSICIIKGETSKNKTVLFKSI